MSNFNTTSNQNQNIYPKSCTYGCNTQIYWNTATNEYWEVFTKKKHICPNRQQQSNQQLPLQHHQQDQLITIKNHGPILNQNQKCPIPVNY
jgi:hypothetical protein